MGNRVSKSETTRGRVGPSASRGTLINKSVKEQRVYGSYYIIY